MKRNSNLTTEEGHTQVAKEESKIEALDLAQQIHPLLSDFFCGIFEVNANGIVMKMENGQVFQLSVKEVA